MTHTYNIRFVRTTYDKTGAYKKHYAVPNNKIALTLHYYTTQHKTIANRI